jgi:hypothetical protein
VRAAPRALVRDRDDQADRVAVPREVAGDDRGGAPPVLVDAAAGAAPGVERLLVVGGVADRGVGRVAGDDVAADAVGDGGLEAVEARVVGLGGGDPVDLAFSPRRGIHQVCVRLCDLQQ